MTPRWTKSAMPVRARKCHGPRESPKTLSAIRCLFSVFRGCERTTENGKRTTVLLTVPRPETKVAPSPERSLHGPQARYRRVLEELRAQGRAARGALGR